MKHLLFGLWPLVILLALVVGCGKKRNKYDDGPAGDVPSSIDALAQNLKKDAQPPKKGESKEEPKKNVAKEPAKKEPAEKEPAKKETVKKEEPKKPSADELLNKAEAERLKKLDGELALLDFYDRKNIEALRARFARGDFSNVTESEYQTIKTEGKFLHKGHLRKYWIWRATLAPGSPGPLVAGLLKLRKQEELERFQVMFGREGGPRALAVSFVIQQASREGLSSLTDEQKGLLRPYAEFLGELKR